jgi:predicted nucleic acid-binding protein
MLSELGNTLSRPKFAPKLEGIKHSPDSLVLAYSLLAEIADCEVLPKPIAPDPDDDWVIATAIAAKADLIVTGDKPFLGVGQVGAIKIVTVAEALVIFG